MVWITGMQRKDQTSLKPWAPVFSGESRYLTNLWVQGNNDRAESTITCLEMGAANIDPDLQKIQDKIAAALKVLTFRQQYVLVQFWMPREAGIGKHQFLTTLDQPFGIGVNDDGLRSYRQDSECKPFVIDTDNEEEDCSPVARVFRRGLPEWTPDVTNYLPKHFRQQECAIRCNLHGYLALPVFYLNTRSCVGVLELLTSANYTSYTYEVQQIHNALEKVDLRTQQAFYCPTLNVPDERRQKDRIKICSILKATCDIHSLPLAQTWALSQHTSFVSHGKVIQKSCSSFDTRCIGKVCMSTAALPFHVKDLHIWPFLKVCRERHLDRSCGFVGKALLTRGTCFCGDVTKLSEEEYPLVLNAHMSRLTSCFAIFLHSVEANDDYVLEFFLPSDIKDNKQVLNLVQTLKQYFEIASGFELGDTSCIHVVGPPTEISMSLSTIKISSTETVNNNRLEMVTSDSESVMENLANKTESFANLVNQWKSKQIFQADDIAQHDFNDARKNKNLISYPSVSMQKTNGNITDAGVKNKSLKQVRKRKTDSLTMEAVEKHVEKPINQAAQSLGVSRSTLKRFCRDHGMQSWRSPKHRKKSVPITDLKPAQKLSPKKNLQLYMGLSFVVILMVRVKRWSCSTKRHGFLGKWWSCGKHTYLPSKSDSIYQAARLLVRLRRWRNRNSISTVKPIFTHVTCIKMVTVKATFKDDMIKFQFRTSSGLLELEHEVARRIKIKNGRLRLKYKDEDNDLILLACDADLHTLLGFTANRSTIKLIIPDE